MVNPYFNAYGMKWGMPLPFPRNGSGSLLSPSEIVTIQMG